MPMMMMMMMMSDKSCKENQNICFVFNNFFSKFVPFTRKSENVL